VRRWVELAAFAAVLAGCGGTTPRSADIVATLDSDEVHYWELEKYLEREIEEPAGALDSVVLSRLFDRFLDERLLQRWAVDEDLATEGAGRQEVLSAVLAGIDAEVTDADVRALFERRAEELAMPERVRLRHILVADEAAAAQALDEIMAGVSFADVAAAVSIDANAELGGDQGELVAGDLPEPFAQVVAGLEVGVPSEVIDAPDGFHLFLVEERLAAGLPELVAVELEIRKRLVGARADARLARLVGKARRRYNAVIYAENLPFFYTGDYGGEPARGAGGGTGASG